MLKRAWLKSATTVTDDEKKGGDEKTANLSSFYAVVGQMLESDWASSLSLFVATFVAFRICVARFVGTARKRRKETV